MRVHITVYKNIWHQENGYFSYYRSRVSEKEDIKSELIEAN